MQFSIDRVLHIPQVKQMIINTFFALSIASYYVIFHHTPKVFRWSFHPKSYEIQSEVEKKKTQFDMPLSLHSLNTYPLHPLFAGFQQSFPDSDTSFVLQHEFSTPIKADEVETVALMQTYTVEDKLEGLAVLYPTGSLSLASIQNHFESSVKPEASALPRFDRMSLTHNSSLSQVGADLFKKDSIENTNMTLPSKIDETINVIKPSPPSPPSIPASGLTKESSIGVSQQQKEEVIRSDKLLMTSVVKNAIDIPVVEITLKLDEKISLIEKKVKITHMPSAASSEYNDLQPWYTYKVDSLNPLLRFWLMKLAPKSNINFEEIPFRRALVKTLLSPEFQPYVNLAWEEEDDLDMKIMRAKFCEAYMDKVDWSETSFKQLFITPKKDLHHVNEDAYLYGYSFPLKLGVQAYKDEDFIEHRA